MLRNEGLVNTRRDGKRIFYSIADEKVLVLLNTLLSAILSYSRLTYEYRLGSLLRLGARHWVGY